MAFQSEGKPKKKRTTIADMTPDQIEKARQQRLEWYRKTRIKWDNIFTAKYNNDFNYWKRTTDYQRERYRSSRSNAVKLKPGRKPRSTSNSGDESIEPPPIVRCKGRPRIHGIDENKTKRPPGRHVKSKYFTVPAYAL